MKRSDLKTIIKECIQELNEAKLTGGMDFDEVRGLVKHAKNDKLKVTYGTRTNKWYLIAKSDRDYNTAFAAAPSKFLKYKNEKEAIAALTGSRTV